MFHAVEIDGEAYWDGGYMGNPALFPLIYNCKSTDIVIVHINPLYRKELPYAAGDILNRINGFILIVFGVALIWGLIIYGKRL